MIRRTIPYFYMWSRATAGAWEAVLVRQRHAGKQMPVIAVVGSVYIGQRDGKRR